MTDELYQLVAVGMAWACNRCGVLVNHSDEAVALHNEVHCREYRAEEYEAEMREREG